MAAGGPPALVVFDYDWSLIDTNSDTWIVERLAPEAYAEAFRHGDESMGWTETVDRALGLLHDRGRSAAEVRAAVAAVPFFPEMREALALAAEAGCRLAVLSDANRVFIEEGLKAMKLDQHFDLEAAASKCVHSDRKPGVVLTNEGFEENGRLRVRPFHHNADCPLCPSNLCKGRVMDDLLAASSRPPRVIYVGDGGGDFCAATRLAAGDVVLYRSGDKWGLQQRLQRQGALRGGKGGGGFQESRYPVHATLRPWTDGKDVLSVFREVLAA